MHWFLVDQKLSSSFYSVRFWGFSLWKLMTHVLSTILFSIHSKLFEYLELSNYLWLTHVHCIYFHCKSWRSRCFPNCIISFYFYSVIFCLSWSGSSFQAPYQLWGKIDFTKMVLIASENKFFSRIFESMDWQSIVFFLIGAPFFIEFTSFYSFWHGFFIHDFY